MLALAVGFSEILEGIQEPWHLTCDTRHLTFDTWQLTVDTWHVKHLTSNEWYLIRRWLVALSVPFLTIDLWHTWHRTSDTWHRVRDRWHLNMKNNTCRVKPDTKQVTLFTWLGDNGGFCCFLTCNRSYMTPDMWHKNWSLKTDMWHRTPIKWHMTTD